MNQQTEVSASEAADNPLLEEWGGRFGVPAFDRIKPEHFRPAFARAFAAHAAEVAAIAGNAQAPTFANTIDALEASGETLARAVDLFHLLAGAHTNLIEMPDGMVTIDFGSLEALDKSRP